jgi:hypothetical protein
MMQPAGTPTTFRRVFPLHDNGEVHRSPAGFNEDIDASISVAFFETQVLEGEPIVETLRQLSQFVRRTICVFERNT